MKIERITIEASVDDLKASRTLGETFSTLIWNVFQNINDRTDDNCEVEDDEEVTE